MVSENTTESAHRLLSVSEAAEILGVGQETVREWVRSGRLRSILIGRRNRKIPRQAIDEFIASETK